MSRFLFMGQIPETFDRERVYDGTAKTVYVECGCGRRYEPAAFMALKRVGVQKDAGFTGGDLLLANCACGSTISMEAEP